MQRSLHSRTALLCAANVQAPTIFFPLFIAHQTGRGDTPYAKTHRSAVLSCRLRGNKRADLAVLRIPWLRGNKRTDLAVLRISWLC